MIKQSLSRTVATYEYLDTVHTFEKCPHDNRYAFIIMGELLSYLF